MREDIKRLVADNINGNYKDVILPDKPMTNFVDLSMYDNKNKFKPYAMGLLIFVSMLMSFTVLINSFFIKTNLPVKDSSFTFMGNNYVAKDYTIKNENLKPGEVVYFVEKFYNTNKLDNLESGTIEKVSDMYVQLKHNNESKTLPKEYIIFLKK